MNRKALLIIQITLCLLLLTSFAYAQSQTSSIRYGGVWGIIIVAWICYRARRKAIGGWLLYYYIQLYGGTLLFAIITMPSLSNYNPEIWDDRLLHFLYIISTLPQDLAQIAEVFVASLLLAKRARKPSTVNLLRGVYVFAFIFAVLALAIDLAHWEENIVFDFIGIAWPTIWFFYFTYSHRVEYVFKEKKWESWANHFYPPKSNREPEGVEKKSTKKDKTVTFGGLQRSHEAVTKWLSNTLKKRRGETKAKKEEVEREEEKEKHFPPTTIPVLISILMLFAGIPEFFPYGYYTLLRLVVCGTGGYNTYFAFKEEKRFIGFLSILVALLFNPIIPIHLAKDAWVVIDFITVIFLTITIFALRSEK